MDGPEWAAGKLSEDHKDNRWSLLSADIREIEQRIAALEQMATDTVQDINTRIAYLETVCAQLKQNTDYLERVCGQCILEHQGRSV